MKKLITFILSIVLVLCVGFSFTACGGGGDDGHTAHSFVNEKATAEYLKSAATCTEGAVYYKSCSCGKIGEETFVLGEPIPCSKTNNTDSKYLKAAGNCTTQSEYYVSCSMCGKKFDETFFDGDTGHNYVDGVCTVCSQPKPHEHTFSSEWTHNEYEHWHEAACEHTDEVSGTASHTFSNGACTVCGRPEHHEHTFETTWTTTIRFHYYESTCEHRDVTKDEAEHNYVNGICTVCNYNLALSCQYRLNPDNESYTLYAIGNDFGVLNGDFELNIPAEYEGKPVTAIGSEAFRYISSLTKVVIPEGVTSIGDAAFENCEGLVSVTIPASVTSIGTSSFLGCKKLEKVNIKSEASWCNIDFGFSHANPLETGAMLYMDGQPKTDFVIPDGVETIKRHAFYEYKHLTSITIPSSVTSIGESAFYGCVELLSVTIPENVTSIGDYAFYDCRRLVEVYDFSTALTIEKNSYNGYVGWYTYSIHTVKGAPSNISTSSDGFQFIFTESGDYLINYRGTLSEVTLPNTSSLSHPYEINQYAFYDKDFVTKVTIPDSVTKIGSGAFKDCDKLESVTIGTGVTEINSMAFEDCVSLKSIAIPQNVKNIRHSAFKNCSKLASVTVANGVEGIESNVFEGCVSLTSISLPASVTAIGTSAFSGCTLLAEVTFSDSAINIEGNILTNTAYYNNQENWQGGALYVGKHIIKVNTDVAGAFTVKDGTLSIAAYAFANCNKITTITIPSTVKKVGNYAFTGCTGITTATMPTSVISALRESPITVAIINGGDSLYHNVFDRYTKLTTVTIPESVTVIDGGAFINCGQLATINLPSALVSIEADAFYDTAFYKNEANWDSDGVLYLGTYLIKAKNTLSGDYTVKAGTTVIAEDSFYNCAITGITICDSVKTVGLYAFENCGSLVSAHIGAGVTLLEFAFASCDSLASVTFANGEGWYYINEQDNEISHTFGSDAAANAEFVNYNRKLMRRESNQ